MPAKRKGSRAASRAKPVLNDITNKLSPEKLERFEKKKKMLLDNFNMNVTQSLRQLKMEHEIQKNSIQTRYDNLLMQLKPYSQITLKELFENEKNDLPARGETTKMEVDNKMEDEPSNDFTESPVFLQLPTEAAGDPSRVSDISSLLAMTNVFPLPKKTAKKKKAATPSAQQGGEMLPPSSCRTRGRPKKTPGPEKLYVSAARTRKGDVTPLHQQHKAHPMVTPKFNPLCPLPPGTLLRKPSKNEVVISLQGSPVRLEANHMRRSEVTKILKSFIENNGGEGSGLSEKEGIVDELTKKLGY